MFAEVGCSYYSGVYFLVQHKCGAGYIYMWDYLYSASEEEEE